MSIRRAEHEELSPEEIDRMLAEDREIDTGMFLAVFGAQLAVMLGQGEELPEEAAAVLNEHRWDLYGPGDAGDDHNADPSTGDRKMNDAQRHETPLTVEVKDGVLQIRLGVETLKVVAERMESCNPFNEETGEFEQLWRIVEPLEFAEDVVRALTNEREDGSTKLTDLIDAACLAAIEDGSLGVE